MKKILLVALAMFGAVFFFKYSPWGATAVSALTGGGVRFFPLVTIAALIDSVNPCAFSILLVTIAFLVSLGRERSKIIAIGASYIAGIFAVYLLIGLGLLEALHFFNTPHFMAKVGAGVLIFIGALELIGHFFPKFPIKIGIPSSAHGKMSELMKEATLPAAFLLGAFVGMCEFPCTGGPYLMILGLLHDSETAMRGVGYLVYYNLVFVLPLVVILLLASHESFLTRVRAWKSRNTGNMRLWAGIAMVVLGLLMLTL